MKPNQLRKSSLALVTIAILATITSLTVRQGGVAKTAHLTAPKDILQFTSGGHILGFAKSGVYLANGSHALRVEFVNAHSTSPLSAASPSETGNTKAALPLSQVTYPNLWDGVTLTYDAPSGAIARSTYRLDPYAKTDNIRLRYNAPVAVQGDGSLRINFKTGTLNESAPRAWQECGGKRAPVQIAFARRGKDEISFTTGHYDRSQPLFIDPTLTWNTFLGGSGDDEGYGLAVDGSGNIYVAGASLATWGSSVRAYTGGYDAFVAKLDANGSLIWNTFLGGAGDDFGRALSVDGSGNLYVAGFSAATWGSPVHGFSGGAYDAFAAKLDSNGNLIWNTFLGGSGNDAGYGLAIDGSGNVYVAGQSDTAWGSPVRAFSGGGGDSFAAKLDSSGNLIWNTFLGSSDFDASIGVVAVDGSGNVYVAGFSYATWGLPVRAYTGDSDVFTAKLDTNGNLIWNTFLGGSGRDYMYGGLTVDGSGNVYVAGQSDGTWGSPVRAFSGGSEDVFAAKLDSNGSLIWKGTSDVAWGSPDRAYTGNRDAFAVKLDSTGSLTWSTFLGGGGDDDGNALAVNGSGNVYVAGLSYGTWGSPVRAYAGAQDAFVAKFTPSYSAQIQQPINSDESSVFNAKRGVIPVKFTLSQGGTPTCALPPATIALTRTAGATTGAVDESVYSGSADTGSNFRISSCQYMYNLSASALGVGTYRVDIKINGQVVGSAIFQLK